MLTAFNKALGTKQGRIQDANGAFVFCLGFADAGHHEDITPGDFALVEQRAAFAGGTKLVRVRARIRPPAQVPAGHKWVVEVLLDDVVKVSQTLVPGGRERERIFSINVSKASADKHYVTVRLRFIATSTAQFISMASFECGPGVDQTLLFPSITSAEVIGNNVVTRGRSVFALSIGSAETIGAHIVREVGRVEHAGALSTGYASGSHSLGARAAPTGIASAYTSGTAVISSAFDPGSLALTAFNRSYSGAPWNGLASAGTSGSGNNDHIAGSAPSTGTLNGFGTAVFNGTSQYLAGEGNLDRYLGASTTEFSGWFLVRPSVVTGGFLWGNALNSPFAPAQLSFSGGNAVLSVDAFAAQVTKAISASAWSLITFRYTGSALQIGVNERPGQSGGASSTAYSNGDGIATSSTAVSLGRVSNGITFNYYEGAIAEFGVASFAMTDTNFNNIKSYINSRYALSL